MGQAFKEYLLRNKAVLNGLAVLAAAFETVRNVELYAQAANEFDKCGDLFAGSDEPVAYAHATGYLAIPFAMTLGRYIAFAAPWIICAP